MFAFDRETMLIASVVICLAVMVYMYNDMKKTKEGCERSEDILCEPHEELDDWTRGTRTREKTRDWGEKGRINMSVYYNLLNEQWRNIRLSLFQ